MNRQQIETVLVKRGCSNLIAHVDNIVSAVLRVRSMPIIRECYLKNDDAHQIDHADWVMLNGLSIYSKISKSVSKKDMDMIIVAAYYHDTGCCIDRDTHHIISANNVLSHSSVLMEMYQFDIQDIYDISTACLQHRSSYTDDVELELSQIIAAADRGKPLLTMYDLYRSYKYGLSKLGLTHENALSHGIAHIIEKYVDNDPYPSLALELYGDMQPQRKEFMDKISPAILEQYIASRNK